MPWAMAPLAHPGTIAKIPTCLRALGAGWLMAAAVSGCSAPPDGLPQEHVGTTSAALSGNDAVTRGALWVAAEVPYCQSPNGQPDPDNSCASVCERPSNPEWDPYRSDCSGFVSWAWNLPAPGRTTDDFAPAVTDITQVIDGMSLLPGDALNIPGDHIILFVSWVVTGQSAIFYEEPGCSANPPYAHQFTSNVEISGSSVSVDYEGSTFTAIRYTALNGTVNAGAPDAGAAPGEDAGTPCFVPTLNASGECMLTSACAALPNHVSTAGYCPGADDIECCTSTLPPSEDAGEPSAADSGAPVAPAGDSGSPTSTPAEDSGAAAPTNTATDSGTVTTPTATKPVATSSGEEDSGTEGQVWVTPAKGCSTAPGETPQGWGGFGFGLAGLALVSARRRRRA